MHKTSKWNLKLIEPLNRWKRNHEPNMILLQIKKKKLIMEKCIRKVIANAPGKSKLNKQPKR